MDEMTAALLADGEKLRQLTGEDHGPWDLLPVEDRFELVDCPSCGGRGGSYDGPCSDCYGTGEVEGGDLPQLNLADLQDRCGDADHG